MASGKLTKRLTLQHKPQHMFNLVQLTPLKASLNAFYYFAHHPVCIFAERDTEHFVSLRVETLVFHVFVNRIFYPGGSASIMSSGYQRAAKVFYELAIEVKV